MSGSMAEQFNELDEAVRQLGDALRRAFVAAWGRIIDRMAER